MRKTKEMYAGGFYLLKGESSANTSFIEDKEEALRFIAECNKRLSGFANIHDFLITKDGWLLVISLLDEGTIKTNYKTNWSLSNRVKEENFLQLVWKIISEQIRQVIFTFVLFSNRKNGREGSKVKRSYERYWFESVEEAEEHLAKMKSQLIRMEQRRKTYRSKKRHFRISNSESKGAIFLCSFRLGEGSIAEGFGDECMNLQAIKFDVLRQLVKNTFSMHFSPQSPNHYPKLE